MCSGAAPAAKHISISPRLAASNLPPSVVSLFNISGWGFDFLWPYMLDYPKDKELCWKDSTDSKNQVIIQKPAFTFETAKYNLKNIESHKKQTPSLEEFFT
jgi:hypothetical protein